MPGFALGLVEFENGAIFCRKKSSCANVLGLVEFENGAILVLPLYQVAPSLGLVEFENGAIFQGDLRLFVRPAGACRV